MYYSQSFFLKRGMEGPVVLVLHYNDVNIVKFYEISDDCVVFIFTSWECTQIHH